MNRGSWLALVVLALIALNVTFVHGARTQRTTDEIIAMFDDDVEPCSTQAFEERLASRAFVIDEIPLVAVVTSTRVFPIAPKTSPPR